MNDDEDFSNVTIHSFLFQGHTLETITETMIAQNTINGTFAESVPLADFRIHNLKVNEGVFSRKSQHILSPIVTVTQDDNQLLVTCICCDESPKLCVHETEVLLTLLIINDYGIFFKKHYRHQQLRKFGKDYGLDQVEDPDEHFDIYHDDKRVHIIPRNEALLKVTEHSIKNISDSLELLQTPEIALKSIDANEKKGIILRQHKFHKYLIVDLFSAATTKSGAVKNPLNVLSPLDFLWQSDDSNLLKFFAAIHKLQQHTDGKRSKDDINALKALIKNPEGYPFYIHNASASEKITLNALQPVKPTLFTGKIVLDISKTGDLYQLSGSIDNKGIQHSIKGIILRFNYFLDLDKDLYLVEKLELFNLIEFLRQKENDIVIHASKFKLFKTQILEKLADKVIVNYKYIPAASQHQLREQGFNHINRKIIYLSESGNHILITPTISYSDTEIPVRSKRQVYGQDNDGNEFLVQRDQEAEIAFTALVSRQHPFFEEQV